MQKAERKTIAILTLAAVLMFGFSFALVPLYRVACKRIGLNTSIPISNVPEAPIASQGKDVQTSRNLTLQFLTMRNQGLNWEFYPRTKIMGQVHPGAKVKVIFYAKNNASRDMIVQAVPSMTPTEAIKHFHKLQCFCFDKQTLKAGESKDMALVFQVDKDLPPDVHTITLAYTLFDLTPKANKKELG